jgi:malate synthase
VSTAAGRLDVAPPPDESLAGILAPEALDLVAELHGRFEPRRRELLAARRERDAELRRGGTLDFLPETREVRGGDWTVPPPRPDFTDRRVEITGPTDRKLVINALNSGAKAFMADFEDANSPTWRNQVDGHRNLIDAIEGTITYDSAEDERHYELAEETATLLVRPRGWHLPERHVRIDGDPVAGAFVDFGLFMFHCARRLVERGTAPYLYLPKLEHHLEARLWNDVFVFVQEALGLPRGTVRATVLVETLPAAFQMDEILFELREHSYGLNAGRWDYIFSMIKCFRDRPDFVLPDRNDVTMTVPFMRAYTELLVRTCHRRGAFAVGGMAALIPSRRDPEANERAIAAVREDKQREAEAGFDGTWVAHPDVVDAAREEFDKVLGDRPNQIDRDRSDVEVSAAQLLAAQETPGAITERGLRNDVEVGFQYISFWLGGRGAAGINNLMEDAATAEITRAQIWQWVHHGATLEDGRTVTRDLVREILDEEMERIHAEVGDEVWEKGRPEETREVFERVALGEDFPEFLTLVAYEKLP